MKTIYVIDDRMDGAYVGYVTSQRKADILIAKHPDRLIAYPEPYDPKVFDKDDCLDSDANELKYKLTYLFDVIFKVSNGRIVGVKSTYSPFIKKVDAPPIQCEGILRISNIHVYIALNTPDAKEAEKIARPLADKYLSENINKKSKTKKEKR